MKIKMNRQKAFSLSCAIILLLISVLPQFTWRVNLLACQENENAKENGEIREAETNQIDYRQVDFFQGAIDIPILTNLIPRLNFFSSVFEPRHITACRYTPSDFFNHSPPLL